MSALRVGTLWLAPLFVSGCNGVFWGNLGVLCVTVGIFLGTVFLTRTNRSAPRATASTSGRAVSARPAATPSRPPASSATATTPGTSSASTSHHS